MGPAWAAPSRSRCMRSRSVAKLWKVLAYVHATGVLVQQKFLFFGILILKGQGTPEQETRAKICPSCFCPTNLFETMIAKRTGFWQGQKTPRELIRKSSVAQLLVTLMCDQLVKLLIPQLCNCRSKPRTRQCTSGIRGTSHGSKTLYRIAVPVLWQKLLLHTPSLLLYTALLLCNCTLLALTAVWHYFCKSFLFAKLDHKLQAGFSWLPSLSQEKPQPFWQPQTNPLSSQLAWLKERPPGGKKKLRMQLHYTSRTQHARFRKTMALSR